MFGFFKETKIVAEAFTDGRWNIMQYTGIDIEKMKGMEKSDLMILQRLSYDTHVYMMCPPIQIHIYIYIHIYPPPRVAHRA